MMKYYVLGLCSIVILTVTLNSVLDSGTNYSVETSLKALLTPQSADQLYPTGANGSRRSNVLLISTWRSGSSWMGELLKRIPNTFYLYEPLIYLRNNSRHDHGISIAPAKSIDLLKQLFQCSISPQYGELAQRWKALYTPKVKCPSSTCKMDLAMMKDCKKSQHTVMKTVRLRLGSAEDLLLQPSIAPLKIIYLTRDPRAIMASMASMTKQFQWTLTPTQICFKLRDDAWNMHELSKLYPDQVMFLRYEDMALNTTGTSQRIWNFLSDTSNQPVPLAWTNFLKERPQTKKRNLNAFSIENKSTKNWEVWRMTIAETLLLELQDVCSDVMTDFGYQQFASISDARSYKRSSLSVAPCYLPPC